MPQDRTLKAIKSRSRSEQVSVVSLLLLPLLGMCCLLIPDTVTDALPYLLGGLMAVSGAAGLVYAVAHASGARADARRLAEEPAVLGRAVVMCVLGGVILVQGHASISFVGVMWGLLGLYKAADEIDRPLHVRFIEYMPVGESSGSHGCGWGKDDVVPSEELFEIINERARAAGMDELVPAGNDRPLGWGPARYFEFPNAQGTVGFISPLSRHFCSECNRLRLTADGKLRPCLFSDDEYDVRTALRAGDDQAVRAVFAEALGAKPDEHHDKVGTERSMSQIGG